MKFTPSFAVCNAINLKMWKLPDDWEKKQKAMIAHGGLQRTRKRDCQRIIDMLELPRIKKNVTLRLKYECFDLFLQIKTLMHCKTYLKLFVWRKFLWEFLIIFTTRRYFIQIFDFLNYFQLVAWHLFSLWNCSEKKNKTEGES